MIHLRVICLPWQFHLVETRCSRRYYLRHRVCHELSRLSARKRRVSTPLVAHVIYHEKLSRLNLGTLVVVESERAFIHEKLHSRAFLQTATDWYPSMFREVVRRENCYTLWFASLVYTNHSDEEWIKKDREHLKYIKLNHQRVLF